MFHIDEESDACAGFAFGVVDGRGREYVLPYSYTGTRSVTPESRVGMMALPPGDYRVATWYVYDAFQTVTSRGLFLRDAPLAQPFSVAPGSVVLLGRFWGSYVTRMNVLAAIGGQASGEMRWAFDAEPLGADEAIALFRRRYPAFDAAPVACLLCSAGPDGAVQASPAPPPADAYASAHRVVLHYHRPDGDYARWGLHVWDKSPGETIRFPPGVSWESPLTPDGVDDFGAYWVLSDAAFASGRVSYEIHSGDEKDQGGKDCSWPLSTSHEAWVVSGDPAVHLSREKAEGVVQ